MPTTDWFFRTLNQLVEPAVRHGFGNSLAGPGLFVIETTGRRSGRRRRTPLLGVRIGDRLVVSTVRRRSQWAANLDHAGGGAVWIAGRRHPTTARVTRPAGTASTGLTVAALSIDRPSGDAHATGTACAHPTDDGASR